MKNTKQLTLPVCYFPTKVIFVDDNQNFLDNINLHLDYQFASYQFFDNPLTALHYLKNYNSDPFIKRCILQEEDYDFDKRALNVDIKKIHEEIYNASRFNQLSVLVIDYTMPGMTGKELLQKLENADYKIILLTGEASTSHAVELFNDGKIDYFIRKDQLDAISLLKSAILRLQNEYMCQISTSIIQSITQPTLNSHKKSCLTDPQFIEFFYSLLKLEKINEFYLYDEFGSFLLIDTNGKTSWLAVLDQDEMDAAIFEMSDKSINIHPDLLSDIKNYRVLRYCFNQEEHPTANSIGEGTNLFYPATKLEGEANYYYCHIKQPLMTPTVDFEHIINFSNNDSFKID